MAATHRLYPQKHLQVASRSLREFSARPQSSAERVSLIVFLNGNTLDFRKRQRIAGTIIKLGRAWAFMGSDGLRPFDGSAVQQIGRNAGRPERVAVRLVAHVGGSAAALDHAEHIDAAHAAVTEGAFLCHRSPERAFARMAERS